MKTKKIYSIVNTKTNETFQADSGKIGWDSTGAAKNAWNLSNINFEHEDKKLRRPKFNEQDVYVIVELNPVLQYQLNTDNLSGFIVNFASDDPKMTDEYNKENKVVVSRSTKPFCDADGFYVWSGSNLEEALSKAKAKLGL